MSNKLIPPFNIRGSMWKIITENVQITVHFPERERPILIFFRKKSRKFNSYSKGNLKQKLLKKNLLKLILIKKILVIGIVQKGAMKTLKENNGTRGRYVGQLWSIVYLRLFVFYYWNLKIQGFSVQSEYKCR